MCSKCIVRLSTHILSSVVPIPTDANDPQAEGRPPPASKSKSIVQGLDVMEQYVEEHYQDANNDWILPDHE